MMKTVFEKGKSQEIVEFYYYLSDRIATASMVEQETNIKQKNICRYKRRLEQLGLLRQVYKTRCRVTGRTAWYITTNFSLITKSPIQIDLFDDLCSFKHQG